MSLNRALVTGDGIIILLLARDLVLLASVLGANAHVELVVGIGESIVEDSVDEVEVSVELA